MRESSTGCLFVDMGFGAGQVDAVPVADRSRFEGTVGFARGSLEVRALKRCRRIEESYFNVRHESVERGDRVAASGARALHHLESRFCDDRVNWQVRQKFWRSSLN